MGNYFIIIVRCLTDRCLTFLIRGDNMEPEKCRDDGNTHFGRSINRLSAMIRYTLNARLTADGVCLTGEQCRLLGYMHRRTAAGEEVYQRDIEREFGVKRSTVSSILANLEKSGYIARSAGQTDGRIKLVTLTDKGKSLEKVMKENIDLMEQEIVRGMTEEEQQLFLSFLKRAADNINSEKEIDNRC